jgi:pimeloyl-ACP methyl ester carboxylesterase
MSLLALLLTMSTTTSQTGIAPSADGVPIHYATQGQGEIALVFVHGWAINRRYWDAQVPASRARTAWSRWTWPATAAPGASARTGPSPPSARTCARWWRRSLLKKVVLIGHS